MGEFDHIVAAMNASPLMAELKEMTEANDYSRLDRNAAKRHHFLSQFLLRGFAEEHSGNPRIFQMNSTKRGAPRRVDVRTAASRHRLYAVRGEDGRLSNRNEGYLALVESHAAPAIRRLIADAVALTPGDRATIAFFAALQTMRTPAAAEQVTEIANAALRTAASEVFSDRRAFAERHRDFFGEHADEAEVEEFRKDLLDKVRSGDVRVSGEGGAAFGTALEHAVENVPMLVAFDWTLLRAPSGGVITSDRGYAIDDPTPPYPWSAQGLCSSEDSQTTVPLDDGHCLLLRPMPFSTDLRVTEIELTPADVQALNLRTFGWADNYVFAKSQETLAKVRIASRRRPAAVVRPRPYCFVALLETDPDDESLAEANRRSGWPARVPDANGEMRDYIVIPVDDPNPELWKQADELAERRARKRAGVGPDQPFDGRIVNTPLHPLDMTSPSSDR